jgi:hypothetical protein
MRIQLVVVACTVALAAARSAMLAAPAQTTQTTPTPGQMTEARVTVQNRGRGQAVPISLQEVSLETPIRVRVINGQIPGDEPLNVRVVQEPRVWQYQTIEVKADENIANALSMLGAAGWETTGVAVASVTGGVTTVLLKRQR